ncbi:hypothetical protein Btru_068251 [Bulinus truncatus]|nr:hypothetical protein Btru_068251 [Bulinus truncatus]
MANVEWIRKRIQKTAHVCLLVYVHWTWRLKLMVKYFWNPNTDARYHRNIKKVKAAPEELHRGSDDSSGDSSECESTSDTSESTAGSSKSRALLRRQQQQHRTVDCNDFEERAKRFLETMSVERRREWLRQQGYRLQRRRSVGPSHGRTRT